MTPEERADAAMHQIRDDEWAARDIIRAAICAAVAAERARCVKVLEDLGHYELAQRLEG